jgi:membrane protein implicated in regulation of membrane protease activity
VTGIILLLALSALIGFALGTSFSWFAIAASSVGIAVLSSMILQIQGFSSLPGIGVVVALLTINQMAYSLNLRNKPTRNQAKVAMARSPEKTNKNKGAHVSSPERRAAGRARL